MNLVKCEILWTRMCLLDCSYCAMADGRRNTVSLEQWKKGIDDLKHLDCQFIAFYGAEPLHDFDKLPETIQYAERLGINTTVITSGVVTDLDDKLKVLYEHGLRSITTSYDHIALDRSSEVKSSKALHVIELFRNNGPVRDSAVVVTLTRQNYKDLPRIIREMSRLDIWTFFDFIHADRGQPGCKVKNTDLDLMFTKEDEPDLIRILQHVSIMKSKGYLCHTSHSFLSYILTEGVQYKWNCARGAVFPSWVTIDCDGTVYPCDDYQPKNVPTCKVWDLCEDWFWKDSLSHWKENVKDNCPGCLWNTHIDAHMIKIGEEQITDYIHGI